MRVRRQAPLTHSLKLFVLYVYLIFLPFLKSETHTVYNDIPIFYCDAFYFSFLLFSWRNTFLASAATVPSPPPPFFFFLFLISACLLFTVFVSVCPGADKLNIHTLFLLV